MDVIISRGLQSVKLHFHAVQLKDMIVALIVYLIGREKFISAACASEKLEILTGMVDELMDDMKGGDELKKEWKSIKGKISRHQRVLEGMRYQSVEIMTWDFITSLDGNPNLTGFGFCQMPFRDPIRGNAERETLRELDKRTKI